MPVGNRRPWLRLVRAVGLRLIVWGGLACGVLIYLGHLRWPAERIESIGPLPESQASSGPEWPHLRGPAYSGVSDETGLADAWPPGGPPVLWNREIGRGYSGIIAVGNRLWTQRQTPTEQSVLCLDAETGSQIWEHRYGWAYEPGGMYPGPRSTPTWHDGRVYFAAPDGLIGCLRADGGEAIWMVNVNKKFGGHGTEFGYSCSPLVEAGRAILPVGGPEASVVALNAFDGSVVWTSGSEPASYCSPIPITLGGRRLVVAFLQNTLALVDLESGKWFWQQSYSHGYDEHAALPVYSEPHLMVMLPFRAGADLYRLEASHTDSAGTHGPTIAGRLQWHSTELSNDTASSVLYQGFVYGFDLLEAQANGRRPSRGQFKCLEFPNGKVRWTTDRVGHASLVAAEGKLFLLNDKGELILARATPDQYEEIGRLQVFHREICWTSPTLHRGRIYLRSPTRAACLDVTRAISPYPETNPKAPPAPATAPPASEPFDLVRLIGREREYPFDPPDLNELTRWYLWSLGALAAAGLAAWLAGLACRRTGGSPSLLAARVPAALFWLLAIMLGLAATPVANWVSDGFVFTWPLAVFVVHELVLAAVVSSQRISGQRVARWVGPAAAVGLVAAFAAYYDLCRLLNLPMAWVFLIGLIPSWPVAVPLAHRLGRIQGVLSHWFWASAAFTLFFWASAAWLWVHNVIRPMN
jgi:outer membrane protein assembly factor BamB